MQDTNDKHSFNKSSFDKCSIPLMDEKILAGFPSATFGNGYVEAKLDLNEYVIKNSEATFFVRVSGDSMIKAGIFSGDLLIVDRSLNPINDSIVVVAINGELTVKRLKLIDKKIYLYPENKRYKPILVNPEEDFTVWGVVTFVVHSLC